MKRCCKCKKELNESDFNKCSSTKDGLQKRCRNCQKEIHKLNKEKINKKRRDEYRAKHPLEEIPEGFKKCSACKEIKRIELFSKSKHRKDGYKPYCKECAKKQYYENIERNKQISKQYYEEHKEIILSKCKIYRDNRKEKESENHKKYYKIHRTKLIEKARIYHEENLIENYYKRNYKTSLDNNLLTSLTFDEWLDTILEFDSKCAYCGEDLDIITQDHIIPKSLNGGYVKNNIIPCCKKCNASKKDLNWIDWYKKQKYFSNERYDKIINFINKYRK